MKIGDKIKQLRKLRNMTQEDLGNQIGGFKKNQISDYESNKITPSADTLQKIGKALGSSLDYLLDEKMKLEDIKFIPQVKDPELLKMFEIVDNFPVKEKSFVKELLDTIIFKHEIKSKMAK